MTKQDLLSKAYQTESNKIVINVCDVQEFIYSNVCITKAENRHHYADVLHEWIEGANMQKRYMVKDSNIQNQVRTKWIDFSLSANDEYRIKPSEHIYEWQYYLTAPNCGCTYTHYMTDDEIVSYDLGYYKTYHKVEETKRVRK